MVNAMNEYAISLINYYTGLVDLEPSEHQAIGHAIRQILIKHRVHIHPSSLHAKSGCTSPGMR